MRYKSPFADFTVYAVAGTYSVALAIDPGENTCDGLLGFSIKRKDLTENQEYFMRGLKVFEEVMPHPQPKMSYSTFDQPIQAFTWEDYTAKPNHKYIYSIYAVTGSPKNLVHSQPMDITVETENDYDPNAVHNVFFNRGVVSSQAYADKFGNQKPDKVPGNKAYEWLSRGLEEAILNFIRSAKDSSYALRGCFYEFHYKEVLDEFKNAADRGVDLKIIYDAKDNGKPKTKKSKATPAFPKEANEQTIKAAKLGKYVIPRAAAKSYIAHNKFIVLLKDNQPVEVWTGSTNISEGGIFGQTNVGHRIKDKNTAANYMKYWKDLSADPETKTIKPQDEAIQADLDVKLKSADLQNGIVTIFSPRKSDTMLQAYSSLFDSAEKLSCITLAFGVNTYMKDAIDKNTGDGYLTYLLLEKDDENISNIISQHNLVKAVGSYLNDPLYQWTRETNTLKLQINQHVIYIHSKFLLVDPLGPAPVVVSGSANFSIPSTTSNDENMIIIKGDKRTADIYYTEFNRIFFHYYFRYIAGIMQKHNDKPGSVESNPGFLCTDNKWVQPYKTAGAMKFKRLDVFKNMSL